MFNEPDIFFFVSHFPSFNLGCSLLLPLRPQWTQHINQFPLLWVERRKPLEDFSLTSTPTPSDRAQPAWIWAERCPHARASFRPLKAEMKRFGEMWSSGIYWDIALSLSKSSRSAQYWEQFSSWSTMMFASFIPHKALSSPTLLAKTNLLDSNQYPLFLLNCRTRRWGTEHSPACRETGFFAWRQRIFFSFFPVKMQCKGLESVFKLFSGVGVDMGFVAFGF